MKTVVGGRQVVHIALLVAVIAGLVLMAGPLSAALAQAGPFGAPRGQVQVGGVLGWIFAKQAEFYRQFSSLIRVAKADGTAPWGLLGLSLPLRHFSCRRPGSRQGGDLVLPRRQPRDLDARRGAVVRLGAVAGLGRGGGGGRCRRAVERDRGDDEPRGQCHRDRELFAHHRHRRAIAVGEGARLHRGAADAPPSRRRRRRRDARASASRRRASRAR